MCIFDSTACRFLDEIQRKTLKRHLVINQIIIISREITKELLESKDSSTFKSLCLRLNLENEEDRDSIKDIEEIVSKLDSLIDSQLRKNKTLLTSIRETKALLDHPA